MRDRITKRLNSFGFAIKGIKSAFISEPHVKIQFFFAMAAITAGLILDISRMEWCLVILCIALVITGELFNTAIEKIMDHVSPEHHPTVGYIKDISAGAVLIIATAAAMTGLLIFLPRLFIFLSFGN
jgi:diacylglycerol kinase (ATP)